MAEREDGDSVLERVRDRLRSRLTPGSWELLSSGRRSLAEVAGGLRKDPGLASRFESLLGRVPREVNFTRFRVGDDERTALVGGRRESGRWALAALVVDRRGVVRQEATNR